MSYKTHEISCLQAIPTSNRLQELIIALTLCFVKTLNTKSCFKCYVKHYIWWYGSEGIETAEMPGNARIYADFRLKRWNFNEESDFSLSIFP